MQLPSQSGCRGFVFSLSLLLAATFTAAIIAADPVPPTVTNDASDGIETAHRRPACVRRMLEDQPIGLWTMELAGKEIRNEADPEGDSLAATIVGGVKTKQAGPRPGDFPLFESDNQALGFGDPKGYLRVPDPGPASVLDFNLGDSITLEAWVQPLALSEGQQVYIIGKGRTKDSNNQNYALRLRCLDGTGRISFLFRDAGNPGAFHRWNSKEGIVADSGWHHVACTYKFGEGGSIRGYLNGKEVKGTWDEGGPTDLAPVVDDDDLWIGSSMGGGGNSTFVGLLDEVAIYRTALSAERIQARYEYAGRPQTIEPVDPATIPADRVQLTIVEGVAEKSWNTVRGVTTMDVAVPAFALSKLPQKYNARGVIDDRTSPFLAVLQVRKELPAGKYKLLLRSLNASRLLVDGKVVAQTDYLKATGSGHEHVPPPKESVPGARIIPQGHQERLVELDLSAGTHVFRQEIVVGGSKLRPEIGETLVAIAPPQGEFELLSFDGSEPLPFTEGGWQVVNSRLKQLMADIDRLSRHESCPEENAYWQMRHELARAEIEARPALEMPAPSDGYSASNAIDQWINAKLAEAKLPAQELVDDYTFLRRVSLDTVGLIPTQEELATFLADPADKRRQLAIDRLLADPRTADHGMGYWQDVLAENPGIVKPTLNNTGPFRTWIYESLVDHKPLDRFATELVLMEGSKYHGGPAGFAMATENDSPLAEKANILAKAFLAQEMKCARCHDAPLHPFEQQDLFSLAAMLNRSSLKIPKGSTVPVQPGGRVPAVTMQLKAGDVIKPEWPFAELSANEFTAGVLRNPEDSRERLAALLTSSRNDRFAQVAVNRLWKRLLGRGLVEPVDDWTDQKPSHPELLEYLARELATHDYDLSHVTRLILNSHVYQRQVVGGLISDSHRLFAGPMRRRLSAEQLVDSMYLAAGKGLDVEVMSLDPEGRLTVQTFLNLGEAERAWQFCSLSTDRDRPSLGLPRAQAVVDLLLQFGWRDYRPNAITQRDEEPNVLQPLSVANGPVSTRIARVSEDSAFLNLALNSESPAELARQVFRQVLSRPASEAEVAAAVKLLEPAFAQRIVSHSVEPSLPKKIRPVVSWSNHLRPEATEIKYEVEKEVLAGDPPTTRLTADWRMRYEDFVWALVNSPEFVFVP